jgi:AbrB family looped-hinge helix DNA binding protein
MQTSVTKRGQTVVPSDIRKKHQIKEGDQLIWLEDEQGIKVIPIPKDPIAALRGRGQGEGLSTKLLTERQEDREREG